MQKKKALRRRGSIDDDLAMYIYNMSVSVIMVRSRTLEGPSIGRGTWTIDQSLVVVIV